jgi:protein-S-isoprenylcysteine O-methyltransferase Ste14
MRHAGDGRDYELPGGLVKLIRAVTFFIATLLIYLGVTLLGWGLDDLAGYLSLPPRLWYAVTVGLFSLAVGIQAYGSTAGIRGGKGEESKFVFRQRVVRIGLVLSLYTALFFIPFCDRRGIATFNDVGIVRWLGVGLSAIGYALVFWSGLALGKQYSADLTIQSGHRLITGSIYQFIRHPRYLGVMALSVGISCVFCSLIGMAASVLFLAVIQFRIRYEEAVMLKEFGAEWGTYCKRSWRLIPYIY